MSVLTALQTRSTLLTALQTVSEVDTKTKQKNVSIFTQQTKSVNHTSSLLFLVLNNLVAQETPVLDAMAHNQKQSMMIFSATTRETAMRILDTTR